MTTILFGLILGFFFGLTGSGGSTLAVPLLVYGIGLAPHRAVCVSMISVGALAALRSLHALRHRKVDLRTAGILAAAGLLGAPVGAWAGQLLPEKWLLSVFAVVVVIVASRLMLQGGESRSPASRVEPPRAPNSGDQHPHTTSTIFPLSIIGLTTGFLAGLLGIGGGFVITPALALFCGLEIHRAITTSMFTIALISVPAMASHWFAGQRPPIETVGLFTLGGLLGLVPGSLLGARLSGDRLQHIFAIILLLLAAFIIARSFGV